MPTSRNRIARHACAVFVGGLIVFVAEGCSPAQIGADEAAFKSVDALYTAVSLRDSNSLQRCQQRLLELKSAGKLPEAAFQTLDSIVAEAAGGRWESAQTHLRDFMLGQRS